MKQQIEIEFQNLLKAAYGNQMICKEQQTDMKLGFVSGMMLGVAYSIKAATENGEKVIELSNTITEIFNETNNNR